MDTTVIKARFDVVSFGGYKGHEFIASYTSTDYLIFRFVGESGVPLVRQMPWFKEPQRKIVAMDFDPSARLLCCITADLSVVIIPIYFIMLRQSNIDPPAGPGLAFADEPDDPLGNWVSGKNHWFNIKPDKFKGQQKRSNSKTSNHDDLHDATIIKTTTKSNPTKVTNCIWWNSWGIGSDYVIFSSVSGSIRFLDLRTHESVRIKCKYPVLKMDIIVDPGKAFKYLLLHTPKNGTLKLLLEQKNQPQ